MVEEYVISLPAEDKTATDRRIDAALFAAFFVLAGAIRFFALSRQSIWNDEMFTLELVRLNWGAIQEQLVTYYHHPPLFFYLTRATVLVLGENEWGLRFISAFAGSLAVGTVYFVSARLFNRPAAAIAAVVLTFSPFHLAYSQEGRPYALAGLLCLFTFYFFWKWLTTAKPFAGILYALSAIALLSTHHWGLFFLFAQAIYLLSSRDFSGEIKKQTLIIWIAIGVLYVPEFFALTHQVPALNSPGFFWAQKPSAVEADHVVEAFAGTYFDMASSIFRQPVWIRVLGCSAASGLLYLGICTIWKAKQSTPLTYAIVCLAVTLGVPFGVSYFRPEVFLWYRYPVIVLPVAAVALAGILSLTEWKKTAIACVIVLGIAGVNGVVAYGSWQKSNVKDAVGFAGGLLNAKTTLLIRPLYMEPLVDFYYKGSATQVDETYLDSSLGAVVDTASSFVYVSLESQRDIRKYFDAHFLRTDVAVFPGISNMGIVVGRYEKQMENGK